MATDSSEVNVARLLAQTPDAVIYASRDGVIRAWNAAAERIFGHSEADAIGQRLDLIVPDRFREAHWTGWERAHGDGVTQYVGQSLPRAPHTPTVTPSPSSSASPSSSTRRARPPVRSRPLATSPSDSSRSAPTVGD